MPTYENTPESWDMEEKGEMEPLLDAQKLQNGSNNSRRRVPITSTFREWSIVMIWYIAVIPVLITGILATRYYVNQCPEGNPAISHLSAENSTITSLAESLRDSLRDALQTCDDPALYKASIRRLNITLDTFQFLVLMLFVMEGIIQVYFPDLYTRTPSYDEEIASTMPKNDSTDRNYMLFRITKRGPRIALHLLALLSVLAIEGCILLDYGEWAYSLFAILVIISPCVIPFLRKTSSFDDMISHSAFIKVWFIVFMEYCILLYTNLSPLLVATASFLIVAAMYFFGGLEETGGETNDEGVTLDDLVHAEGDEKLEMSRDYNTI